METGLHSFAGIKGSYLISYLNRTQFLLFFEMIWKGKVLAMRKRVLSVLLIFVLCFLLIPSSAFAESHKLITRSGTLYDEEDMGFHSFTLPAKGKIKVTFKDDTFGVYGFYIEDSDGDVIYSSSENYCFYEEQSFVSKEHRKGDYYLVVFNADEEDELDYKVTVSWIPTGTVYPTKITLNKTSVKLDKGDKVKLKATVKPSYTSCAVKWSSSNKNVATVNSKGVVKAKALGKVKIKAKCGKISKRCTVKVKKRLLEMWTGKYKNFNTYVKYVSGHKTAKWSTSKSRVASVSSKGNVNTKKQGNTTIKCTAKGDTYSIKLYCYSKKTLKKKAIQTLKDTLIKPDSMHINKITYPEPGLIIVDVTAANALGGYARDNFVAYYLYGKYGWYYQNN